MTRATVGAAALVAAIGLAALGCGERGSSRARCAECGMYVDLSPRWQAGLTTAAGTPMLFDTPICMLKFLSAPDTGRGAHDAWVTDYYTQRRIPAADARFVAGTDVVGPMGRELVPVADDAAATRMLRDHHGRTTHRLTTLPPSSLTR